MLTRGPSDHYRTHLSGRHPSVSDTVPFGVRFLVQRSPPQKPISTYSFHSIFRKGIPVDVGQTSRGERWQNHFPEKLYFGGHEHFCHQWHDSARGLPHVVTRRRIQFHRRGIFDLHISKNFFDFDSSASDGCDDDEPPGLSSHLPSCCHPPRPPPTTCVQCRCARFLPSPLRAIVGPT